jgi:hypothetical protein
MVLALAVSRFVGVPIGPDGGATESVGVLDVLATVAELSCVGTAFVALRRPAGGSVWRVRSFSPVLRLAAPVTIAVTILASSLAARS